MNRFRGRISSEPDLAGDLAAAVGLMALPFFAVVFTKLTGGGLTERYVLPAILGVASATGLLSAKIGRTARLATVGALALAFLSEEAVAWRDSPPPASARPVMSSMIRDVLDQEADRSMPVVISDGLDFVPMAYYAPPEYASRIVALADFPSALRYGGSDSVERALVVLRHYLPLQVFEFEAFTSRNPRFYVYSRGANIDFDSWPRRLVDYGYALRAVRLAGRQSLFLATKSASP